ncbi:hypothetical protein ACP8HZ_03695 [Francisella noatunensis]
MLELFDDKYGINGYRFCYLWIGLKATLHIKVTGENTHHLMRRVLKA